MPTETFQRWIYFEDERGSSKSRKKKKLEYSCNNENIFYVSLRKDEMFSPQKQGFNRWKQIKILNSSFDIPAFCVGYMIKGNYFKY